QSTRSRFVSVKHNRFYTDGQPLFVFSANYWQAMNLGAPDAAAGNRTRLLRDLDKLQSFGVNHLRIMAASEGPDTEPFRMTPSLMPAPGVYNQDVLDGLDFAMAEIGKRGMKATLCMNNYWQWSGGFAQYVSWVSNTSIPYPPSWDRNSNQTVDGDLDAYQAYTNQFYSFDTRTNHIFQQHIEFLLNHRNRYTGIKYKHDPAVFAWQLANEPQYPPPDWIKFHASYIKRHTKHLVSVGLESRFDETEFMNAHNHPEIDYATVHIWAQNRGIYNMTDPTTESLNKSIAWAQGWLQQSNEWSQKLGKPLILEEFGLARDNWINDTYNPHHLTTHRDAYYAALMEWISNAFKQHQAFAGFGFWAYSGESRPGDRWVGDPPHEPPGWYGVYDKDQSTIQVMKQAFE
ncbi:glycoside hydrolase superfamily, partial [Gorgonomyces haynaldii]